MDKTPFSTKKKIEELRENLYNAYKNNSSKEVILEISKKIDRCLVEYYKKCDFKENKNVN